MTYLVNVNPENATDFNPESVKQQIIRDIQAGEEQLARMPKDPGMEAHQIYAFGGAPDMRANKGHDSDVAVIMPMVDAGLGSVLSMMGGGAASAMMGKASLTIDAASESLSKSESRRTPMRAAKRQHRFSFSRSNIDTRKGPVSYRRRTDTPEGASAERSKQRDAFLRSSGSRFLLERHIHEASRSLDILEGNMKANPYAKKKEGLSNTNTSVYAKMLRNTQDHTQLSPHEMERLEFHRKRSGPSTPGLG